jgi:hypothetical protein
VLAVRQRFDNHTAAPSCSDRTVREEADVSLASIGHGRGAYCWAIFEGTLRCAATSFGDWRRRGGHRAGFVVRLSVDNFHDPYEISSSVQIRDTDRWRLRVNLGRSYEVRYRLIRAGGLLAVAAVLLDPRTDPLGAQSDSIALRPVVRTVNFTFKNVISVRELSDGRALLWDGPAQTGYVIDRSGSATPITGVGGIPSGLAPLSADSTLLHYILKQSWVIFQGSQPVAMVDKTSAIVQNTGHALGADTLGNVLALHSIPGSDSASISLLDRTDARERPIANIATPPASTDGLQAVYPVREEARLAPDGWVAVLRMNPYRVDWRMPTGKWIQGAPIPYDPVPLDQYEKEHVMTVRARGAKPERPSTVTNWPQYLPAFMNYAGQLILVDGSALVQRYPKPGTPIVYDLVNRDGSLQRRFELPTDARIVGFGTHSIYVGTRDDAGQHIVVREWP